MKEVDLNALRDVVKILNQVGELTYKEGKKTVTYTVPKIKVIGKKKEDLLAEFAKNVESTPDAVANELPAEVILFYNENVNDEEGEPEPENDDQEQDQEEPKEEEEKEEKEEPEPEKPAKKATPKASAKTVEKKEKATEKEKEKKERKAPPKRDLPKDEFGYVIGTGANLINRCIIDSGSKGATKEEMKEASGRTVDTHLYALIKVKNAPVVVKDGRYYYAPNYEKKATPKATDKKATSKGKK